MNKLLLLFLFLIKIPSAESQLYFNFLDYPSPIIFDDIDDFINGSETTLLFEVGSNLITSGNIWDITLYATDDLRFGNRSIPVENIHINVVNKTPGQNNPFLLSQNERFLIRKGRMVQFRKPLPVLVKLKALGGADFMVPAGAYTTTLVFTLIED